MTATPIEEVQRLRSQMKGSKPNSIQEEKEEIYAPCESGECPIMHFVQQRVDEECRRRSVECWKEVSIKMEEQRDALAKYIVQHTECEYCPIKVSPHVHCEENKAQCAYYVRKWALLESQKVAAYITSQTSKS